MTESNREKGATQRLFLTACSALLIGAASACAHADSGADKPGDDFKPYTQTIPGTNIQFEMVPIPGGRFTMGSPEGEEGRGDGEGPQVQIIVEPFWMGKYEVTWKEYKFFMDMYDITKDVAADRPVNDDNRADAVGMPTPLYDPSFTFGIGEHPDQPAATMSQYAAKQYTKMLSLLTRQFYRLPTEAEWEYACRAGTKTAYSFGDDMDQLTDYGWFFDNSEENGLGGEPGFAKVGQKKPNPWGLYDMHGNVSEWVIDQYVEDHYAKLAAKGGPVHWFDAIAWPTELIPRVLRGGNWDSDPEELRSAARKPSDDKEWRIQDPNVPNSPWWFTEPESRGVGFRLIRPYKVPPDDVKKKFWEADDEWILDSEGHWLKDGKGIRGLIDPENLPKIIEQKRKQ